MRERVEPRSPRGKLNKWWLMGAIATPVCLGMVGWLWLLPHRSLQPDEGYRSHNESTPLVHPHREASISDLGAIAAVAAGVFLLFKFRMAKSNAETLNLSGADFCGADLNGADFCGADLNRADLNCANLSDANLSGADLSGANLNGAELSGANLSGANLSGANLITANLNGADLNRAGLRYANLSGANLRYANLSGADFNCANLSGADLNCALISDANLSDANLSGALLFFINSREALNLEPFQLKAQPSPFLCNVALPAYAQQPRVNPNRDCDRIPQLLSTRYDISLEEAQGIVDEARQHHWD
ncbi:MAG: pentapeptide repeat-containing protein [Cyanobacteria bacterium P01_D01_bin.115]